MEIPKRRFVFVFLKIFPLENTVFLILNDVNSSVKIIKICFATKL
ncbi:hypothetical protein LEP1GSC008_3748 [Leptospira kirschneri serovar Bulgarica str. Nikolaevo]|uniref:Uncharacterized protein n=1 Tax=Leptospira kirschneri serovar Bulgarica str. Nikolaevo TaxID=1240687 RepID=M6F4W6_9LEPT|nr:hypothetical protein LEP1GSC008_3748 [Leptospira kirschneri serovar Bulgarica str. Nikolaevo]